MKAAAYARYSTDKQTENSIAYQMEAITKYCHDHDIEICARYSDEAKTGTNTNRKDFQALLRAAERREFDAVVVYDISRGSRDVVDWFAFRKTMQAAGVQVISTTPAAGGYYGPQQFFDRACYGGLGPAHGPGHPQKIHGRDDGAGQKGALLRGAYPAWV